jgi:hypothetical protein
MMGQNCHSRTFLSRALRLLPVSGPLPRAILKAPIRPLPSEPVHYCDNPSVTAAQPPVRFSHRFFNRCLRVFSRRVKMSFPGPSSGTVHRSIFLGTSKMRHRRGALLPLAHILVLCDETHISPIDLKRGQDFECQAYETEDPGGGFRGYGIFPPKPFCEGFLQRDFFLLGQRRFRYRGESPLPFSAQGTDKKRDATGNGLLHVERSRFGGKSHCMTQRMNTRNAPHQTLTTAESKAAEDLK